MSGTDSSRTLVVTAVAASATALVASLAGLGWLYRKLRAQRRLVAETVTLRDEERAGRIRAEKELRKIVQDRVADGMRGCRCLSDSCTVHRPPSGLPGRQRSWWC